MSSGDKPGGHFTQVLPSNRRPHSSQIFLTWIAPLLALVLVYLNLSQPQNIHRDSCCTSIGLSSKMLRICNFSRYVMSSYVIMTSKKRLKCHHVITEFWWQQSLKTQKVPKCHHVIMKFWWHWHLKFFWKILIGSRSGDDMMTLMTFRIPNLHPQRTPAILAKNEVLFSWSIRLRLYE